MIRPLKILISILAVVVVVIGGSFLYGYRIIKSVDAPSYSVYYKGASFETRQYAPYVIAEAIVKGSYDEAMAKATVLLDGYLAGDNASSSTIFDGFLPIRETVTGEKGDTHLISYIFPSNFTLAMLPRPNSNDVHLFLIQKQKVAVRTFRGIPNAVEIERQKNILVKVLTSNSQTMFSEPVYIRTTPTTILPLMVRNEVQVEI